MKNSIWQVLVNLSFILVFLYSNSLGSSLFQEKRLSIQQEIAKLEYSSYEQNKNEQDKGMEEDIYQYKDKSTKKAFIYSLFVPGVGEYYAESKVKSAVFLGLEAAFWIEYFHYHNEGQDKENEYKAYADQNWSEQDYLDWLGIYCENIPANDHDSCVHNDTTKYWTEHLPDTKNQEYYEMIGKYDQFNAGWRDVGYMGDMDDYSALRNSYIDMRHNSNKLFDKAKYSIMAVLANHLLSAFDAAWTAKRYNQKAGRFAQIDFKLRMTNYKDELVPKAFVTLKF
jgi:hypothetical protein